MEKRHRLSTINSLYHVPVPVYTHSRLLKFVYRKYSQFYFCKKKSNETIVALNELFHKTGVNSWFHLIIHFVFLSFYLTSFFLCSSFLFFSLCSAVVLFSLDSSCFVIPALLWRSSCHCCSVTANMSDRQLPILIYTIPHSFLMAEYWRNTCGSSWFFFRSSKSW